MSKSTLNSLIILCFQSLAFQSFGQTITSVQSQQAGNTIEVKYTLSTTSPCEIALYVSLDGGTTWKGPLTKVQGDVGKNISAGEHTITWQVLEELEELTSDNTLFKVASVGKKPFEPEMVFVEGDAFMMGSTVKESTHTSWGKNSRPEETPQHLVKVSSFYLSKFEVTQAQWQAVMGTNPSLFKYCPQCPVENVSYDEVIKFITKLNGLTGVNYRLPNEAEWEFAYRGGIHSNKSHYNFPEDSLILMIETEKTYTIHTSKLNYFSEEFIYPYTEVPHKNNGWFSSNSESKTHKTGLKSANILGLYDMGGNVAEWCSDWYSSYENGISVNPTGPEMGDKKVVRGGSFADKQLACRYASRKGYSPSTKTNKVGFRLALSAEHESDPAGESTFLNQEFAINPVWSYLKVHNLTKKGEREFLKVYTNPDSCKIIWNFTVANQLTDLTENEFCEWLLHEDRRISKEPRALARLYFFDGMTRLALGDIFNRKKCDADLSFDKGIKYDESCAQLFYGRGYCALWFGGQSDLIEDFEKAYSLDNSYTKPLMELADYYNRLSHTPNREKAFNLYTKVITIDPQNVHAYEQRAMISGIYGRDYSSAIKDITKCIDYSDNKCHYYEARAEYKVEAKDYQGAIDDLTEAIEIGCSDCFLLSNRALIKNEASDYSGAIADYTTSINCYSKANAGSDYAHAYLGRGEAKFYMKDYSGAAQDFTRAIELNKGCADVIGSRYDIAGLYSLRGNSYFEGGKYNLAIADYDKIIALQPDWVIDAYYQRGLAKLKIGSKETGCQDLRKAADLGNKDAIDAVRENCQ